MEVVTHHDTARPCAVQESLAEADDLAIAAINLSRKRYAPGPPDPVTVAFAGHVAFRLWQQVRSPFRHQTCRKGTEALYHLTSHML